MDSEKDIQQKQLLCLLRTQYVVTWLADRIIFHIFVNDLPQAIRRYEILMFADDTVMFFASKSVSEIEKVLTVDLATLHQWLLENNLFLNVKKTKCLLFGAAPRLSKIENFKMIVGCSVLKRVTEYKYLGVTLDEHLNWKAHTSILFSKASKRIGCNNYV